MEQIKWNKIPLQSTKALRLLPCTMPSLDTDTYPRRYRDNDNSDLESQSSSIVGSDEEIGTTTPKWYNRGPLIKIREFRSPSLRNTSPERRVKRKTLFRKWLVALAILAFFGVIAAM